MCKKAGPSFLISDNNENNEKQQEIQCNAANNTFDLRQSGVSCKRTYVRTRKSTKAHIRR